MAIRPTTACFVWSVVLIFHGIWTGATAQKSFTLEDELVMEANSADWKMQLTCEVELGISGCDVSWTLPNKTRPTVTTDRVGSSFRLSTVPEEGTFTCTIKPIDGQVCTGLITDPGINLTISKSDSLLMQLEAEQKVFSLQLSTMSTTIDKLQAALNQTQMSLSGRVNDINTTTKRLEPELLSVIARVNISMAQIRNTIEALGADINVTSSKINNLTTSTIEEMNKIDNISTLLDTISTTTTRHESVLNSLSENATQINTTVGNHGLVINATNTTIEELDINIAALTQRLGKINTTRTKLGTSIFQHNRKLEEMNNTLTSHEISIEKLDTTQQENNIANMSGNVTQINITVGKHDTFISDYTNTTEDQVNQTIQLMMDLNNITSQTTELETIVSRNNITQMDNTLTSYGSEISEIQNKMANISSTVEKMRNLESDQITSLKNLSELINQLDNKMTLVNTSVKAQNSCLEELCNLEIAMNATKELDINSTPFDTTVNATINQQDQQVTQLKDSAKNHTMSLDGFSQELANLEKLANDQGGCLHSMNLKVEGLTTNISTLVTKIEDVNRKLELANKSTVAAGADIVSYHVCFTTLSADVNVEIQKLCFNETSLFGLLATLQALTDGFHAIDSNVPSVYFHATGLKHEWLNSMSPLIFDNERYNFGNAYDKSTGVFTAPFNGSYFFIAKTAAKADNLYEFHYLQVNDVYEDTGFSYNPPGAHGSQPSTVHCVKHLSKGDKVWVASGLFRYLYDRTLSSFSGFLIARME